MGWIPFLKIAIALLYIFRTIFILAHRGKAGIFTPQPAVTSTLDAAAPLQPEGKAGYISRQ